MNKSYLIFSQKPEPLLSTSEKESVQSEGRFLHAELVEQALSKESLPEKLREKLSNQKSSSGTPFET